MAQSKILYTIGKVILMPAYKLLYRYKNIGSENIPKQGGFILACNHLSFILWRRSSFSKINSQAL